MYDFTFKEYWGTAELEMELMDQGGISVHIRMWPHELYRHGFLQLALFV